MYLLHCMWAVGSPAVVILVRLPRGKAVRSDDRRYSTRRTARPAGLGLDISGCPDLRSKELYIRVLRQHSTRWYLHYYCALTLFKMVDTLRTEHNLGRLGPNLLL